jgi:type IV pilus assembly protein PilA
MIQRLRKRQAFTLIELLVVIVIIAILMAIAIPAYLAQQTRAQDAKTKQYLNYAYRDIRASLPEANNIFQKSTSLVNVVSASEPQLSIASGDCAGGLLAAAANTLIVDSATTNNNLTLCSKSQSGNLWKLTSTPSGAHQLLDGSAIPLSFVGSEVTDTMRLAGLQGDGRSSDSSTGVWEGSNNMIPSGGDADLQGYNGSSNTGSGTPVSNGFYRFNKGAPTNTQVFSLTKTISITNGTTYTWSAIIRTDGTGWDFRTGTWDASLGAIMPVATVVDLGNGTYRLSGTWTATATLPALRAFDLWTNTWGTSTYVDVKWIQAEQKSVATPYMLSGSPRAASNIQAPASLVNGTQSWAAMRIRPGFASAQTGMNNGGNFETYFSWQIDVNNRITCFWDETTKRFNTKRVQGGAFNQSSSPVQSFNAGDLITLIFAWNATTLYVSVNGAAFTTNADTNIPAGAPPSLMDIGARPSASQYGNADVLWFASGTGTLTNADASSINGFGNNDPIKSGFSSSALADFTWNGSSAIGSIK